jgi:hypothetical protein
MISLLITDHFGDGSNDVSAHHDYISAGLLKAVKGGEANEVHVF